MDGTGDPRDPKVDAADRVERIPFAETRNYVQRVMENLAVYRERFGDSTAAIEPQPAMRSPDKEREPVPVASDAERPLPNAWRDVPRRPEG
jgi:soluble lytic murein transglycosylase